jgi:hypothetical protein
MVKIFDRRMPIRRVPPRRSSLLRTLTISHTGGPFSTAGLAKPFTRIAYRVEEIGVYAASFYWRITSGR